MQLYPKKHTYVLREYYDSKFKKNTGRIVFYIEGNVNLMDGYEIHTNRAKIIFKDLNFEPYHTVFYSTKDKPVGHYTLQLEEWLYDEYSKMYFMNKQIDEERVFIEII